jgi:hypothetical protein
MRLFSTSPAVLSTVALFLSTCNVVSATPKAYYKKWDELEDSIAVDWERGALIPRQQCQGNACGWNGWLCCGAAPCSTDANNQAQCNTAGVIAPQATGGSGYWQYYTSIWVETSAITKTAVYSTWIGTTAATPTAAGCPIPCGSSCCQSGQYCLNEAQNMCAYQGTTGVTPAATPAPSTASPSPPLRPTSSGLTIVTATVSATTTVPFQSAVPTGANVTVTAQGQGGGGLSGGAIAGIVIGVIVGIILLILLCLYCCARALFDTVMGIFGLRKRKVREDTYIEEHHHTSGGAGGRWYGADRPSRPKREKKGGFGGIGAAGAALAGLAIALGLKRRHDRKHEEKSDYGSSYYYSDYTSSSK